MGCGSSAKRQAVDAESQPTMGLPSVQVPDNSLSITECYDLENVRLGEGSYGSVQRAARKGQADFRYAVKSLTKPPIVRLSEGRAYLEGIEQEVAVMTRLDHPNIVRFFESFEDDSSVYLVMELCPGGELFDRLVDAGRLTEEQAAPIMQQTFRALLHMHQICHICHRDVKPENVIFQTMASIESSVVKLIDFGFARRFERHQVLTTTAGAAHYVAPEVLAGGYGHKCDLWSCGVLLFRLLCGYPPFSGDTEEDVLAKVRLGRFSFDSNDWEKVSDDATDLIRMLLEMNPRSRYTAEQALGHEWIKRNVPKSADAKVSGELLTKLEGFRSHNMLKRKAIQHIARQLDDAHVDELRQTFMSLDANGDGLVTANELKEGLLKAGCVKIPRNVPRILSDIHSDGSPALSYTEFLAANLDKQQYAQASAISDAFKFFARDGGEAISRFDLEVLFADAGAGIAEDAVAAVMTSADKNGDGELDFDHFLQMMQSDTGAAAEKEGLLSAEDGAQRL